MIGSTSRAQKFSVHHGQRRGVHRTLIAAVSVSLAVALGAALPAGSADAAPATHAPPVPHSLLTQPLTWSVCYPGQGVPELKCASVIVPLDWAHPTGPKITIEISRIKAADPSRRQGVLFTNPGGPGNEGLDLPLFIPQTDPSIAAAFDLIGIDQRGVGTASPTLQCANPSVLGKLYSLDGRDTSRRNQAEIKFLDKKYARLCSSAPLTRYIQHSQTVRDFDLVRRLLHQKKINYLGFSGGTQLGAWYAATFPQHTGRFVLDGNLDWTSPTYESFNRQPKGFQHVFNGVFERWAAKYHVSYALGRTARAVDATYEHRRAALGRHPITLTDGSQLNAAAYDNGIVSALYVTYDYPDLATAMQTIEHYATATADEKQQATGIFSSTFGVGEDPFWSIVCQDDRSQSYAQDVAEANYFRTRYPLTGASWNENPCPFFTLPVTGSPVRGSKLPPMLMLNNDQDPATPLKNALIARSRTPRARLVIVRNEPQHTIYGYGDTCADGYANRYLLTGKLPKHDVSCPGLPLPVPKSAAQVTASGQTGAAREPARALGVR